MNYTEVKNIALSYSDRADNTEVVANMDSFMRLVESRIDRQLKRMEMSERATILTTADQEYYGLPTRFNGIVDIEIRDSLDARKRYTLEYVSHEQLNLYAVATSIDAGLDKIFYSLTANQLQIMPPQTGKIIEMIYWRKINPLTSANTTNWVSDNFPDLYVNGLVVEICKFVRDWEAATGWDEQFLKSLDEANQNNQEVIWSAPSLTTRLG